MTCVYLCLTLYQNVNVPKIGTHFSVISLPFWQSKGNKSETMQGQEFNLDISQISNVWYPMFVALAPKYMLKLNILELKIFVIPLPWLPTKPSLVIDGM